MRSDGTNWEAHTAQIGAVDRTSVRLRKQPLWLRGYEQRKRVGYGRPSVGQRSANYSRSASLIARHSNGHSA